MPFSEPRNPGLRRIWVLRNDSYLFHAIYCGYSDLPKSDLRSKLYFSNAFDETRGRDFPL